MSALLSSSLLRFLIASSVVNVLSALWRMYVNPPSVPAFAELSLRSAGIVHPLVWQSPWWRGRWRETSSPFASFGESRFRVTSGWKGRRWAPWTPSDSLFRFCKTMLRILQRNFRIGVIPPPFSENPSLSPSKLPQRSAMDFFRSELTPPHFGGFPKIHPFSGERRP